MLGLFNLSRYYDLYVETAHIALVCLFRTVIAGWCKILAFVTECSRIRRSDFQLEDAEFTADCYDRDTRCCTHDATTKFSLTFARMSLILGREYFSSSQTVFTNNAISQRNNAL